MAAPAEIDCTSLVCQDPVTSSKGARTFPICTKAGGAVVWQPRQPLQCPWEPGVFGDDGTATRLNISFSPLPKEVVKELQAFDAWCLEVLAKDSKRLFGSPFDAEEIKRRFQPSLRVHEKTGAVSLRCKLSTTGRSAVRCWDTFRNARTMPDAWTACSITPRIAIKAFWTMGKDGGVAFELTHALLDETTVACPF